MSNVSYSTAGQAAGPARGHATVTRMNGNRVKNAPNSCETVYPGLPAFMIKGTEPNMDGVVESRTSWTEQPGAADQAELVFDGIAASGAPKGRSSVHSIYRTGVVPAVNLSNTPFAVGDEVEFVPGRNEAPASSVAYHGVDKNTIQIVGIPKHVDAVAKLAKSSDFQAAIRELARAGGVTSAGLADFVQRASASTSAIKMVVDAVKKAQRGHARVVEPWGRGRWARIQIKRG